MPLPRFDRLASAERERVLRIAARHVAGRVDAEISMNDLAGEAGLSRSGLYTYFDGRADLLAAVGAHARARVLAALGPWSAAADAEALWSQLRAGDERLRAMLRGAPELRALLRAEPGAAAWVDAMLADARRLRLVRSRNDSLVHAVTLAVLAAVDAVALDGGDATSAELESLLRAVWSA